MGKTTTSRSDEAAPTVQLLTSSDIALRLGQPPRRIRWVLATRPHIRPAARAGNVRVYSTAVIAVIQDEIDAIEARQKGSGRKGKNDKRNEVDDG